MKLKQTDHTLLTFFYFQNIFEKSTCTSTHYHETSVRLRVEQEVEEQSTFVPVLSLL